MKQDMLLQEIIDLGTIIIALHAMFGKRREGRQVKLLFIWKCQSVIFMDYPREDEAKYTVLLSLKYFDY